MRKPCIRLAVTDKTNWGYVKGDIDETIGADKITEIPAVNTLFGENKIQKSHNPSVANISGGDRIPFDLAQGKLLILFYSIP